MLIFLVCQYTTDDPAKGYVVVRAFETHAMAQNWVDSLSPANPWGFRPDRMVVKDIVVEFS